MRYDRNAFRSDVDGDNGNTGLIGFNYRRLDAFRIDRRDNNGIHFFSNKILNIRKLFGIRETKAVEYAK